MIFHPNTELKKRINIVTGHYGSGKTTISQNLAFSLAAEREHVAIVDLDTVNPFYRTADLLHELEAAGIEVITPLFARTGLDVPSVPPQVYGMFARKETTVIFDVGGDDAGALALSQYRKYFAGEDYDLFCVVNKNRMLIADPMDAKVMLEEIEYSSRLKVTGLFNGTNLCEETDAETILGSMDYFAACAEACGVPALFTAAKEELIPIIERKSANPLFPIKVFTKRPY